MHRDAARRPNAAELLAQLRQQRSIGLRRSDSSPSLIPTPRDGSLSVSLCASVCASDGRSNTGSNTANTAGRGSSGVPLAVSLSVASSVPSSPQRIVHTAGVPTAADATVVVPRTAVPVPEAVPAGGSGWPGSPLAGVWAPGVPETLRQEGMSESDWSALVAAAQRHRFRASFTTTASDETDAGCPPVAEHSGEHHMHVSPRRSAGSRTAVFFFNKASDGTADDDASSAASDSSESESGSESETDSDTSGSEPESENNSECADADVECGGSVATTTTCAAKRLARTAKASWAQVHSRRQRHPAIVPPRRRRGTERVSPPAAPAPAPSGHADGHKDAAHPAHAVHPAHATNGVSRGGKNATRRDGNAGRGRSDEEEVGCRAEDSDAAAASACLPPTSSPSVPMRVGSSRTTPSPSCGLYDSGVGSLGHAQPYAHSHNRGVHSAWDGRLPGDAARLQLQEDIIGYLHHELAERDRLLREREREITVLQMLLGGHARVTATQTAAAAAAQRGLRLARGSHAASQPTSPRPPRRGWSGVPSAVHEEASASPFAAAARTRSSPLDAAGHSITVE